MSFIQSKATLAAAAILADIRRIRTVYDSAADILNSVVRHFLALPDADLAEFGNMMAPAEMESLLGLHAQLGAGNNQASVAVEQLLATLERRAAGTPKQADIRPLTDKLAAQKREMVIQPDGKWLIRPICYPPEVTTSLMWGCSTGEEITIPLAATNGPVTWTVTDLPKGMKFDGKDTITCSIKELGDYKVTLEAKNERETSGPVVLLISVVEQPPIEYPVDSDPVE